MKRQQRRKHQVIARCLEIKKMISSGHEFREDRWRTRTSNGVTATNLTKRVIPKEVFLYCLEEKEWLKRMCSDDGTFARKVRNYIKAEHKKKRQQMMREWKFK